MKASKQTKDFMGAKAVADMAGISLISLHYWRKKGWLCPHRRLPSGTLLFDPDIVAAWIEGMNVDPSQIGGENVACDR